MIDSDSSTDLVKTWTDFVKYLRSNNLHLADLTVEVVQLRTYSIPEAEKQIKEKRKEVKDAEVRSSVLEGKLKTNE